MALKSVNPGGQMSPPPLGHRKAVGDCDGVSVGDVEGNVVKRGARGLRMCSGLLVGGIVDSLGACVVVGGDSLGASVGDSLGACVVGGDSVCVVGDSLGACVVGDSLGVAVGDSLGFAVGNSLGFAVVGLAVVGFAVVGALVFGVGFAVVGLADVGFAVVGFAVGLAVSSGRPSLYITKVQHKMTNKNV